MNRLLEGDVGSGKTVVAVMAAAMAMRQGMQVAVMAPTEILARQHIQTFQGMLQPLGLSEKVDLLVGGLHASQKHTIHERIQSGKSLCVIGTQALLQDSVAVRNLRLVIVDEQHRFGVDQRTKLQEVAGHAVHVLSMSATPIPRSLALTLYGELDISVIAVKPDGRQPTITQLISPNSRAQLYDDIGHELDAGRQAFIVCPLVADSDNLKAVSAEQLYSTLSKGVFKDRRIGLIHGKMKPAQKDTVMQNFANHRYDILVATTVIEVGVDIPNATIMVIENADRFGLAQIHQLRGRVGRSEHQGYCYLVMSDSMAPSRRMKAIAQTHDGFVLAELDLELRGPGAIYGTHQHGQLDLRVAKLSDKLLIARARAAAQAFIDRGDDLLQYGELSATVQRVQKVTNLQ